MTNNGPRDGKGRWTKGVESIARDQEAARLRSKSWTYPKISDHLGYGHASNAQRAVMREIAKMDQASVDQLRQEMIAVLDGARQRAQEIMDRRHFVVQGGKIVHAGGGEADDGAGEPLEDAGPVLRAMAELRALVAEQAKLLGAHAPQKVELSGSTVELAAALEEAQREVERARAAGWSGPVTGGDA